MSNLYGFPDIEGFYSMLYGTAGVDFAGATLIQFGQAAGMVFNGNPPYTVTDFFSVYAKFAGPPTNFTGLSITQGSNVISGFTQTNIATLAVGQLVVSMNVLQKDSLITAIDLEGLTITISQQAVQASNSLTAYTSPFLPLIVILSYVTLARASVMHQRYHESWFMAVSLFVAHYCTLFMRTESGEPNLTASQVASSGLTKGIIVHRQAGDVSATSQIIEGYEQWGAWGETQYGELFMTIARATSMGPIWVR